MPTKAQLDELKTQCEWKWVDYNGVNGYFVKSKSNKNCLFLPAAGYRHVSSLGLAGSYGSYWSRALNTSSPDYAYCLNFDSGYVRWDYDYCYIGLSVRPVRASQ